MKKIIDKENWDELVESIRELQHAYADQNKFIFKLKDYLFEIAKMSKDKKILKKITEAVEMRNVSSTESVMVSIHLLNASVGNRAIDKEDKESKRE